MPLQELLQEAVVLRRKFHMNHMLNQEEADRFDELFKEIVTSVGTCTDLVEEYRKLVDLAIALMKERNRELASIDMALNRRALDQYTSRYTKVMAACQRAAEADRLEAELKRIRETT